MKQVWTIWGVTMVGYVIFSLILTWPVIGHLNQQVAGAGGDLWQSMWRLTTTAQAVNQAVVTGTLGQLLSHEFLGQGDPRLVNLSAWPWLWLVYFIPMPASYNLIWLLSYVLAGVGMFGLCQWVLRTQTRTWGPSFIAGLFYLLLPYHVAHSLGHFGAMQIQWLPFIIWIFLAWWEKRTWLKTIVLGLFLILQAWTEHHYILWLGIAWIWFIIWYYWNNFHWPEKKYLAFSSILLVLGIVGIALPYWPTVRQATVDNSSLVLGEEQTIRFSADALAYIVPASFHTLWGYLFEPLYDSAFTGNIAESTHFLGIVPLLLIIFFQKQVPLPQKRLWVSLAGLFWVISLGPRLHILGWVTPVRLPWDLLQHLPVLDSVRAVGRASVMVDVSMAVLLAWVLSLHIHRRINYWLIGGLIILEFLSLPQPMESATLSPVYSLIKNLPGQTLIELPAATNYVAASRALYASTIHGKEVLGSIALERAQTSDELEPIKLLPGIRQLLYLRTTDVRQDRLEFFGQDLRETLPDVLRWEKVSAILLHTDSLSILQTTSLTHFLDALQVPRTDYNDMVLYNTSAITAHGDGVFLRRGDGWANVGYDQATGHTLMQLPKQADIHIFNITSEQRPVSFELSVTSATPHSIQVLFDTQNIEIPNVAVAVPIHFTINLPPGEHVVTFINQTTAPMVIQDPRLLSTGSTL